MSSTATGPSTPLRERRRGDRCVVQVAGAAVSGAGHVVTGRPGAGIGERLAGEHEIDSGERAVGSSTRRLPGSGADESHRVVGEPARFCPHSRRWPPSSECGVREHVGDDAILTGILGQARPLPFVPGRGEVGEQLGVVHLEQRLVGVRLGLDEASVQLGANRLGARRCLGSRGRHADPDLRARLVEQTAIAPNNRQRELHRATLHSSRERASRAAWATTEGARPANRRARSRADRLDRGCRGPTGRARHRLARRAGESRAPA